ncbi:MAG TPA: hypothetical protein VJ251_12435, partial [Stellaceae bacterium]|nr:hypothetical protein [Stellaceae bacterium]
MAIISGRAKPERGAASSNVPQPGAAPSPAHKAIEECCEFGTCIERENMRDVLVRSHDNHATPVSIDAPHVENVMAA